MVQRDYTLSKELLGLAVGIEAGIIATSLWGGWLLADRYAHGDPRLVAMMMLMPIAGALTEAARVPLAIAARVQASLTVRILAVVGLLCAAGVTTRSIAQLSEMQFRPRLLEVTHAQEAVQSAEAARNTIDQAIAAADVELASRRATLTESGTRARSAAEQLAALPKDQCTTAAGVDKNGQPWRRQVCRSDPRIAALQDALHLAITARDADTGRVQQAAEARGRLDPAGADQAVAQAETAYREAVENSQMHSFAGMLYGISPADVTDTQLSGLLRLLVLLPSGFVALASAAVAIMAVQRREPELVPFSPDGVDYLLDPIYRQVLHEVLERIAARHDAGARAALEPAS